MLLATITTLSLVAVFSAGKSAGAKSSGSHGASKSKSPVPESHNTHANTHASHSSASHGHAPAGHGPSHNAGHGPHGMKLDDAVTAANRNLPSSVKLHNEGGKMSYEMHKAEYAPVQAANRNDPPLGSRITAAVKNIGNIAKNAFDNTIGVGVAAYQNRKSEKELAANPDKKVAYLMHGLYQNKGSQWRLAKQLRKQGYVPYHVSAKHSLSEADNLKQTYAQMKKLHEKAGIKDASSRKDLFSGHSSGGDMAIYLAGDANAKEYGIGAVQARAPSPTGIEARTIWQKLMMPIAGNDNSKTPEGQERVAERLSRKPTVPVYVVAGEYDRLATPELAVYKHAKNHTKFKGANSTHFGTSGSNAKMNLETVNHLNGIAYDLGKTYTQDPAMYQLGAKKAA